jgi:hypothetical protein
VKAEFFCLRSLGYFYEHMNHSSNYVKPCDIYLFQNLLHISENKVVLMLSEATQFQSNGNDWTNRKKFKKYWCVYHNYGFWVVIVYAFVTRSSVDSKLLLFFFLHRASQTLCLKLCMECKCSFDLHFPDG